MNCSTCSWNIYSGAEVLCQLEGSLQCLDNLQKKRKEGKHIEKHKEKKHKKEKKDREKKDKRDKERSKDKHKDKKDRKEKNKSKDKKRDKDKDKDKSKTADEKKIEGKIENHNGEKTSETSRGAEELKNSRVLEELGKRIRNEQATADQVVDHVIPTDQRRTEGAIPPSEKIKEDRRQHRHRDREDYRIAGNQMAVSLVGQEQRRQEGMGRAREKELEKKGEGKEKSNDREGDDKRENKHRDKDWENKRRKDRDKEKEKEKEKVREKLERGEQKHKEHDKLKESGQKDPMGTFNINQPLPKSGEKSAVNEGKLKKRKEFEMNGFVHENDIQPNKLPRPSSSSHLPMENGRKLEASHIRIPCASDRQGAPVGKKVETNKEHKINGVIENVSSSIGLRPPHTDARPSSNNLKPPLTVEACENSEVSPTKPPHPDMKYLSQIYSIPKMDEWIDCGDDQEWLFGGEKSFRQDTKVEDEVVETGIAKPLVWAEAMQIESADICALPYVIPY
ncbi:uncharacterized protein [Aristolochia californica]|uniref:uncharacterized protein isoform X2 n=1 Tax=Aristolochia californica TaxID=171875 RepID=UPI0035DCD4DD